MKAVLESLGFEELDVLERPRWQAWACRGAVVIAFVVISMTLHPGNHLDALLHSGDWLHDVIGSFA